MVCLTLKFKLTWLNRRLRIKICKSGSVMN